MGRRSARLTQESLSLARSKPVVATACLSLHRLRRPTTGPGQLPVDQIQCSGYQATAMVKSPVKLLGELVLSVPKRLLARAVDRNGVRRIAREHCRGLVVNDLGCWVWMLRLRALPEGYRTASHSARRQRWHVEFEKLVARARHSGLLVGPTASVAELVKVST